MSDKWAIVNSVVSGKNLIVFRFQAWCGSDMANYYKFFSERFPGLKNDFRYGDDVQLLNEVRNI